MPNFGFIVFESTEAVERALAAKPIMLYGSHRSGAPSPLGDDLDQAERGGEEDASSEGGGAVPGQEG